MSPEGLNTSWLLLFGSSLFWFSPGNLAGDVIVSGNSVHGVDAPGLRPSFIFANRAQLPQWLVLGPSYAKSPRAFFGFSSLGLSVPGLCGTEVSRAVVTCSQYFRQECRSWDGNTLTRCKIQYDLGWGPDRCQPGEHKKNKKIKNMATSQHHSPRPRREAGQEAQAEEEILEKYMRTWEVELPESHVPIRAFTLPDEGGLRSPTWGTSLSHLAAHRSRTYWVQAQSRIRKPNAVCPSKPVQKGHKICLANALSRAEWKAQKLCPETCMPCPPPWWLSTG